MSTVKALIERRPLLAYYFLAFAISWGGVLAVVWLGGVGASTGEAGPLLALEITAMLGGPSVSGVLLTWVVHGKAGLGDLRFRLRRWRVGGRWYAAALLPAPVVLTAVLASLSLASPAFVPGVLASGGRLRIILFGAAAGVAVGFLEELGWTGFAVPELRRRHPPLRTALVVGVLWGAWHILTNAILASGTYAGTRTPALHLTVRIVGFLVGGLPAFRILMVWVHERTGSLPLVMLMHASLTASTLILSPAGISGTPLLVYDLVSSGAWWLVVATVAAVGHRGQVMRAAHASGDHP